VLGVCAFAVAVFVALYPNLSALPMSNTIISVYNALLPTWFYGFQFSVNLQESAPVKVVGTWSVVLTLLTLLVAGLAAWAAWEHRVVVGFRRSRLLSSGTESSPATEPAGTDSAASDSTSPEPLSPEPASPDGTDVAAPKRSRKDKPPS
jgi:hypothetical protein